MPGCMGGIGGIPGGILGWPAGIAEGPGAGAPEAGTIGGRWADAMEGGRPGRDAAAATACKDGA